MCLWTIYEEHTHQLGGYKHGTKPYRALKQFRPVRGISMECPHPTQERGWARGAMRGQEVSGVAKRVQEKAREAKGGQEGAGGSRGAKMVQEGPGGTRSD
jgi:hypothetical protein